LKRIWITRASPGAEATAERVRALGYEPVIAPVLQVRDLPGNIDLAGVGALAFTSANAVRMFAARSATRDLPVFTVGAATAAAAEAAGFPIVVSAEGDVDDLARAILARADTVEGVVLHPAAAEPAGDLIGALANGGVEARAVTVYETVHAEVPARVQNEFSELDGVLIHSPRAGRRVAEILRASPAPNLIAYCLSPQISATLTMLDLGRVATAPLPTEDALLSLLAESPPRKST
jgi:uroporphyrinogen-III synthase